MTIKEFMNEWNISYKAVKALFRDAKANYNLENYEFIIFRDNEFNYGMRYVFKIDFKHNLVYLMHENENAKYSLYDKYNDDF